MIVRLLFVFSLSPKLGCETVLARGATLENLLVYSYKSVQYWCGGAALLAKALDCVVGGVAFGKCAAWVGLTVGLDMPKSGQIRGLVARIEVAGARILNAEARILLADAPFLLTEARIHRTDASFEVAGARILLAGARILLAEAPILKQVRRFLNHPAYFMNQVAYFLLSGQTYFLY